ncbi:hypothetical protein BHE74_00058401, partial [Ensete ventricosum]
LERIRVSNAPTVVVSVCSSSESSLVREAVERLVSDLAGNGRCRSSMPLVDSAMNQSRRLPDSGSIPLVSSLHPKSRSTPLLSVGLVILGAFLLVGYSYSSSGPDTCAVVSTLLKEDDTEAWGVEPYDLEDADSSCKRLVRKGVVRSADIKFSLPYRPKSFSVVIVSDALDYLSPKYLNKTLPDLARVSSDGLVIFAGQQRAKASELAKFGKPVCP